MDPIFPRLVGPVSAAILLAVLLPTAWAQPRFGPPQRMSAEAAGKEIGGPTLITLRLKDAPPAKVFQDLTQQVGLALDDYAVRESFAAAKPMTVDFDKQPFWLVVRTLAAKLDVSFSIGGRPTWSSETGWTLTLQPGRNPKLHGPAQVSGPFVIIASSVARSIDLTEPGVPDYAQQAVVEFVVLVDPKLRTRGRPRGRGLEVLDAKGGALKTKDTNGFWTHEVDSPWPLAWRFKAIVELPDPAVRKLGKLKGTLRGFLATTKSQVWEVDDILMAKNLAKESGEASFFITGVAKEAVGRETVYTLTLDSAGAGEEADFGWPPRTEHDRVGSVRLLDSQGRGFYPESSSYDSGKFLVKFRSGQRGGPATQGEPVKLLWELPVKVVEMEIPLEFKDLPIP